MTVAESVTESVIASVTESVTEGNQAMRSRVLSVHSAGMFAEPADEPGWQR
ncbi:hypothetical protein [Streptomyces cinerochromogenes]|uniref:hypothetical protein n=1 Tax=Streptomyces cinerochromogenes TaxID=66422 RepID=UPI0016708CFE|nr:hypothetical protein [Streptomyces cinerochromogenes]